MFGKLRIAPVPEGLVVTGRLRFGAAGWKEHELALIYCGTTGRRVAYGPPNVME